MDTQLNPISEKVTAAVVAGALTTLIVWLANLIGGVEIPAEAATAITTVIAAAAAWFKADPVRNAGVAILNSSASVTKENVESKADDLIELDAA